VSEVRGCFSFFFAIRSNFNKLKTPDQWLTGCGRAGSAECITKGSRCIVVVLVRDEIEIEMNVSGSSRKGRDSMDPFTKTGGVLE